MLVNSSSSHLVNIKYRHFSTGREAGLVPTMLYLAAKRCGERLHALLCAAAGQAFRGFGSSLVSRSIARAAALQKQELASEKGDKVAGGNAETSQTAEVKTSVRTVRVRHVHSSQLVIADEFAWCNDYHHIDVFRCCSDDVDQEVERCDDDAEDQEEDTKHVILFVGGACFLDSRSLLGSLEYRRQNEMAKQLAATQQTKTVVKIQGGAPFCYTFLLELVLLALVAGATACEYTCFWLASSLLPGRFYCVLTMLQNVTWLALTFAFVLCKAAAPSDIVYSTLFAFSTTAALSTNGWQETTNWAKPSPLLAALLKSGRAS